ncbi:MAG: DUF4180 domain-containing protein [Synergistaceae bacterium]|jgi:hypothetical protein|nr:DUF4180 domain-containing protein [Synergistaceae bacterium]
MPTKLMDTPNGVVAFVHSDIPIITDGQSALEFAVNTGAHSIVVNKAAIAEDFFRLSTGVAGEVAQKLVNYGYRLVIIGDFSHYTSKPLHAYIYECNKGKHLCFVDSEQAALEKFGMEKLEMDKNATKSDAAKPQIMEKIFNIAGPNVQEDHYMLDPLRRVDYDEISRLIDQRQYFVLRAPRQTGKTTSLLAMTKKINAEGRCHCVCMNVKSALTAGDNVEAGMEAVLSAFDDAAENFLGIKQPAGVVSSLIAEASAHAAFMNMLRNFCKKLNQPLVLFIDELDALIGDTLISVLRQLRTGYIDRPEEFPSSVILCGIRDVRDYRIHMPDGGIITGGSCFNIKAASLRLKDFSQEEIRELYEQHTAATGQIFEENVYPAVWDLTHGQPWLVNALARQAAFEMPEGRDRNRPVTVEMIEKASNQLIFEGTAHLDQLAGKLREPRVRSVLEAFLTGGTLGLDLANDDIQYVIDYGFLRRDETRTLVISNGIYREMIPRQLSGALQDKHVWGV